MTYTQYYKIGLVFGAICVFSGILELMFIFFSNLSPIINLWAIHMLALVTLAFSSIAIGGLAVGKIFAKPLVSIFVCGECEEKFWEEIDLRRHYLQHLVKQ